MAIMYRLDGTKEKITPSNGVHWTLEELQALVGGYIEVARTRDGDYLIVDEDGKMKNKLPNHAATALYVYGEYDIIVGEAVVIDNELEMKGPPDEEDDDA
jgi:hypothetical protein